MTAQCLITHIRNIQCLYKDLANKYVNKLKIGKVCKEAEISLLVIQEYIETLYCYNVDEENCLTEEQLCCIINHTYKLLKECNC